MLLLEVCTTSQQERTQAAGSWLEVFDDALQESRQSASQRGCRKSGRVFEGSRMLLLEARRTEREAKLEGTVPMSWLDETSRVDSMGSVPITCSSAPVTRLLDRVRAARLGK